MVRDHPRFGGIEAACGLELINLPGPPNAKPLRAWAVDCQLGRMAEIKVTGAKRAEAVSVSPSRGQS